MFYPNNYALVSGIGNDEFQLVSFDKALFSAGVSNYNLVKVSSILPSSCIHSSVVTAKPGSIIFAAIATYSLNNSGIISSAIGVGIPKRLEDIGVIMEFSCNEGIKTSESSVREMVRRSMVLRGIDIAEIKTTSIEAKTSDDKFTTVFSALVMW